jgi:hypothetical protein
MSYSDYIKLKKLKQTHNNYPHVSSSNYTDYKFMDTILNSCEMDDDGEDMKPTLNTIPITDTVLNEEYYLTTCAPNKFVGIESKPLYSVPPRITTINVKKAKHC